METGRSPSERAGLLVKTRAPAWRNSELPILVILSKAPETGLKSKIVIEKVKSWYDFDEDELVAVYPDSRKNVVDTIIKFARKNLVEREEIYPVGVNCTQEVWKALPKGLRGL